MLPHDTQGISPAGTDGLGDFVVGHAAVSSGTEQEVEDRTEANAIRPVGSKIT
jgi:hypothetical protein